jgi:hypothetical protein
VAGRPGDRASDETGQQNKDGGLAIDVCPEVFRRWHPVAARAQRAVTVVGKQFVDGKPMQAGSPGLLFGYRFRC